MTVSLLVLGAYVLTAGAGTSFSDTVSDAVPRLLTTTRPLPARADVLVGPLLLTSLVSVLVAVRLPSERRVAPVVGGLALYVAGALLTTGEGDPWGLLASLLLACALVGWVVLDERRRVARRLALALPAALTATGAARPRHHDAVVRTVRAPVAGRPTQRGRRRQQPPGPARRLERGARPGAARGDGTGRAAPPGHPRHLRRRHRGRRTPTTSRCRSRRGSQVSRPAAAPVPRRSGSRRSTSRAGGSPARDGPPRSPPTVPSSSPCPATSTSRRTVPPPAPARATPRCVGWPTP